MRWEHADDEAMRTVVASGDAVVTPQLGHSVHVEVEGLRPDRWYFYQFRTSDAVSPVGRTRTAPLLTATPDRLRFAFASCQHFEQGLFGTLAARTATLTNTKHKVRAAGTPHGCSASSPSSRRMNSKLLRKLRKPLSKAGNLLVLVVWCGELIDAAS